MIQLNFPTTNNEAEYEALVVGLDLAKAAGAKNVVVHCDSQVVTSQINGGYECKNERMKMYLKEVKNRIGRMCRPISKSSLGRIYACPRTGIVICPNLLTY